MPSILPFVPNCIPRKEEGGPLSLPMDNRMDLYRLRCNPEKDEYVRKVSMIAMSDSELRAKHVASSANWLILHSSLITITPLMFLFFRIMMAISSTAIVKRSGDAQHSCLTPLDGLKYSEVCPAFRKIPLVGHPCQGTFQN